MPLFSSPSVGRALARASTVRLPRDGPVDAYPLPELRPNTPESGSVVHGRIEVEVRERCDDRSWDGCVASPGRVTLGHPVDIRCGDGGLTENGTRGQTRGSSDARGVAGTGAGVSARTVSLPCAALGASACVVLGVSGRRIGDFSPSIGHREHSPRFLSQKFLGLSTSFTRSLRDFFLWPREFAKWIRTNGSSNVVRGYRSLS